jgi:predicted Zn-dependent peptidase
MARHMIRTTTLPNGAKIITEVVDEVYSASIGIWIDVGSEDEDEKNNGVSHCLEHMLFKGTKKRTAQEISQEIEDVGGSLGAATGKENTCFYGRVMGDQLSVAVDLLVDMLLNAQLTDEDLELERQVILEEIKMYEDDPEDFAHETMILNIWPGHPLSRPITGTNKSVSGINRAMLVEHVDRFYRPEKMIISIAGKFNEEKTIEQLASSLGSLKRGNPKKSIPAPSMHQLNLVKHKDIEQAHVSIATIGLKVIDDKRYEIAILDLCLGGNMSSRLFQEVREKRGLVYTINSFRESHRECGLFGVYAGTSPKQISQVLALVSEEFQRVKQDGFTPQEIARAKTQLKSELLLGLESMRNRTARNAYGELFYGRQLTVEEIVHDIDAVTGEQVRVLANELLLPQYLSTVVVGPATELKESYSTAC